MVAPPLRVLIVDDEPLARSRLRRLLGESEGVEIAGEAASAPEARARVAETRPDLLLLDIQMPGMGGLEVARHLASLPDAPAVVFVTAHDRHAIEAFELNALDYLLKPVRAARLAAALRKACATAAPGREQLARAAPGARQYFSVPERNRIVLVPVREVIYFKAELKYVTLRTRSGEHLIEEPLIALEREFAEQYVRIHRNCLVARAAVRSFERAGGEDEEPHWNVVLEGIAERLPVSRRQWPVVKELVAEGRE